MCSGADRHGLAVTQSLKVTHSAEIATIPGSVENGPRSWMTGIGCCRGPHSRPCGVPSPSTPPTRWQPEAPRRVETHSHQLTEPSARHARTPNLCREFSCFILAAAGPIPFAFLACSRCQ